MPPLSHPRQQCENMQETLAATQEKATMGHRLHSMEAEQRRKNGEEEKDGEKKATAKEEKMEAKEEKEAKAEGGPNLDACKHEIDLLRETKRRLLQRLQLDVTFTFPDLLIENAVKTTMDEMKDANDTIARAARDQLWDARRKIGVLERQLAKESRRSQKYATMATERGGSDREVRLTLSLQKR